MKYAECQGSDVSWAKCYGSFKIPSDWKAGEVRTCQWVWKLVEQTYVDCFEFQVTSENTNTQSNTANLAVTADKEQNADEQREMHLCLIDD